MEKKRKWIKGICPAQIHDMLGMYNGIWMPQMDRQWESDDGFSVSSRLLDTDWGKVEHVSIVRVGEKYALSQDGTGDIPWKIKMEIKNELFGEKRPAIEIFPEKAHMVDACDVYHLWVFEKGFKFPFGIHPKDTQAHWRKRGYSMSQQELEELQNYFNERKD